MKAARIETEAAVGHQRSLKTTLLVLCLVGLSVAGFWLGERMLEVRNVTKDCQSECRLAQIREMLLIYYEQHGSFPPTKYQAEANGPIHSWRVLLVPHTDVDFADRYRDYDFSREWNSKNNVQALGNMPYFGYFSLNGNGDNEITNYLAIGEGDEWPARGPLKSCLVTKGKDRFLVVECPDSEIHWMEPKY